MRFRIALEPWQPVERTHLIGVGAFTAVVLALLLSGDPGWTPILDSANLAFHEAGHMFYGLFGDTASLYGGVLGQLTFPITVMIIFFFRREAHGVAVGGIWAAQNLFNIARYMADARAGELPLVGGGEHDFEHIFTRWGALHRDVDIASYTRMIGWIGIVMALAWLYWRSRRSAQAR
ncbi:MAG: hypothetical protein M4D80_10880 [Myxococcota bacterium]|nr:hypothetical protein [Deltaproteobacteria bacterium]MDQ3335661.1 hypothetical protein [Myxococcota bacterium]